MKILLNISKYDYGNKNNGMSFEYENFYLTLKALGHEVEIFDFLTIENDCGKTHMNISLIEKINRIKPDIVFSVFHAGHFETDTLKKIKSATKASVIWMTDDEWLWEGFSKTICFYFDYVITTDPQSVNKYRQVGYMNVILSHWGANTEKFKKLNLKKDIDVSFVGLVNPWRQFLIDYLAKNNINVVCFGSGWENGRLTYEEMNRLFCRSKIVLNISNSIQFDWQYLLKINFSHHWNRKINYKINLFSILPLFELLFSGKRYDQIKARIFEVPASGSFLLTNSVPEISRYFDIGKEIDIYKNKQDLIDKIRFYLRFDKIREKMAFNAYNKTIKNYSYLSILKKAVAQLALRAKRD